jgi:hypothetical protein
MTPPGYLPIQSLIHRVPDQRKPAVNVISRTVQHYPLSSPSPKGTLPFMVSDAGLHVRPFTVTGADIRGHASQRHPQHQGTKHVVR